MEIFIISAEKTVPIANPLSGNRVGDAVLHYKPADGTIPLPINSRPSNRGHGCILCDHCFAGGLAFHDDGAGRSGCRGVFLKTVYILKNRVLDLILFNRNKRIVCNGLS